ncbi:flagella basal body P-ring formation protein FlgA [Franzmannia pantelleriensis]|uniref:Flagella basal body P-ring formation protein FlgA n=1 Tax=Franzmannia pantelleriensis TaxID=48727 RepID=A0A1G9MER0_9GAMM|nr:flagellar basal body P-ring formation chaperone FlgA [Halomonas pantelleriensis]SDL72155.1 flagella basal body P-ring formation protein FlgA [Halomonas pantelleriensis]
MPLTPYIRISLATLLAALCLSAPLAASAEASRQLMVERVHGFLYERTQSLGSEVHIEVHPPSAHLPTCESPEPFMPNERSPAQGRVSVGVRCGEQGQQVRYMQASIAVIGDYVVLRQDIPAGTLIEPGMLELSEAELGRLPRGVLTDLDDVIGQESARALRAGSAITSQQLREVTLVERGASVRIEAVGNGFAVSREGQALDSGGMGREIRVRLANREILSAEVSGRNRLSVDF